MKKVGNPNKFIPKWTEFLIEKNIKNSTKFSSQVQRQVDYLKSLGECEYKFTILDSKNGLVWAMEPDFTVFGCYSVLIGADYGDRIKTYTFKDYIKDKLGDGSYIKGVMRLFYEVSDFSEFPDWIDENNLDKFVDDFFKPWIENKDMTTPAGVFRRSDVITDTINNLILTMQNVIYGKRYITWETVKWRGFDGPDGKEIPHGFHGTEEPDKIHLTKQEWTELSYSKNKKMGFGCILFKESDILDINDFIDYGDFSFWLPSTNDNIFELEPHIWFDE